MAKGFITLENGKDYSVRWTGYDGIIRIVIRELYLIEGGEKLSEWLGTMIPNKHTQEGGALFYDEADEMILRIIDLRGLTEINRQLFWLAVENGAVQLSKLGKQYSTLNPLVMTDLINMHKDAEDIVEIVEEDADYVVTCKDVIEKIGPGWRD